jgi:hypothetical protein
MSTVRRLTAEQIDQVVALLRSQNEEYLALGGTGRTGAGYGHRDGVFYALAVDDELRGPPSEVPFKSEGDLRVDLRAIDLDDTSDHRGKAVMMMKLC